MRTDIPFMCLYTAFFILHAIPMCDVFQAADSIGQVDAVAVMIEEAGGVDKIEQL